MFFGPRASNLGPIQKKIKMGKYRPKNLSSGKNQKSLPSLGPDISKVQSIRRTDGRTETPEYKRYHPWWVTLKNKNKIKKTKLKNTEN